MIRAADCVCRQGTTGVIRQWAANQSAHRAIGDHFNLHWHLLSDASSICFQPETRTSASLSSSNTTKHYAPLTPNRSRHFLSNHLFHAKTASPNLFAAELRCWQNPGGILMKRQHGMTIIFTGWQYFLTHSGSASQVVGSRSGLRWFWKPLNVNTEKHTASFPRQTENSLLISNTRFIQILLKFRSHL